MSETLTAIQKFVDYAKTLRGDEKGEAQVFCDRLFQAFGHGGYKEAGAELESRQKRKAKGTGFIDLLWTGRLLLEMKKRGEKLQKHYTQAFEYWLGAVPHRPRHVVLCNFDEFWIYDFNIQMDEPLDRVRLDDLPRRYEAFNFLFPTPKEPLFRNNLVAVTRKAADKVAQLFNHLTQRTKNPLPRDKAQRYVLQCVLALFAQGIDLLPHSKFSELLHECKNGASSFDLIGGLFHQMANPTPAEGGRFQDVRYFNGGLFSVVEPVELNVTDLWLLDEAAKEDWSMVKPAIFGTLFEGSMGQRERHAFGAHFTSEADIQKVVLPTIVRPWRQRITDARTARELLDLRQAMLRFHVLDPACGSGNFLYIAYRELKRLELELLEKIYDNFGGRTRELAGGASLVSASQFFGLDIKEFAVELAKVTLMVGKKLALEEAKTRLATSEQHRAVDIAEPELPLDNLDANLRCDDALFCVWPPADAIIGNPPYLGSRYLAKEHGYDYAKRVYVAFPDVPKMADFCVYWFRRAHDTLPEGGRAGLVATNTIRQNETREASLDYVLDHGGTITEAVSTQVWSGEAAVHVSIVNWIKGESPGPKKLFTQKGDDPTAEWMAEETERIPSMLSTRRDVTGATVLAANQKPKRCYVGQYPFHEGFLLDPKEAREWTSREPNLSEVLFPYMIGRDLIEEYGPSRWIIDFGRRDMLEAMRYPTAFERVKEKVMPTVLDKAEKEKVATGKESTRWTRMAGRWWQFRDYQPGTMAAIAAIPRYIACSRVTKRPIFEFVRNTIHPDNTLMVFPLPDDYSFGILQSGLHWAWFTARCSTLKGDFRYTADTVFDTFPWPQAPTLVQPRAVADAAVSLRTLRREIMASHKWSLRDLYRTLDVPGKNPLRDAQDALDAAVRAAYGMTPRADTLAFLLALNQDVAAREAAGEGVIAPGLPPCVLDAEPFVTDDCISPNG